MNVKMNAERHFKIEEEVWKKLRMDNLDSGSEGGLCWSSYGWFGSDCPKRWKASWPFVGQSVEQKIEFADVVIPLCLDNTPVLTLGDEQEFNRKSELFSILRGKIIPPPTSRIPGNQRNAAWNLFSIFCTATNRCTFLHKIFRLIYLFLYSVPSLNLIRTTFWSFTWALKLVFRFLFEELVKHFDDTFTNDDDSQSI